MKSESKGRDISNTNSITKQSYKIFDLYFFMTTNYFPWFLSLALNLLESTEVKYPSTPSPFLTAKTTYPLRTNLVRGSWSLEELVMEIIVHVCLFTQEGCCF